MYVASERLSGPRKFIVEENENQNGKEARRGVVIFFIISISSTPLEAFP